MIEAKLTWGITPNTIDLNEARADTGKERSQYKIDRVEMDSVEVRTNIESLGRREGAADFGMFRGKRFITLIGHILAPDLKTLIDMEDKLKKFFNPRFAEFLDSANDGYLPLKWTETTALAGTRNLQMLLKPYKPPRIKQEAGEELRRSFEIFLVAISPKRFDQALTTITGLVNLGSIANGDDFAFLVIRILAADFTSPGRITNNATGKFIELTGALTPGSTLTIDMEKGTIKEGATNKISMFTAGSEFWDLAPGSNQIALTNITKIDFDLRKAYA